MTVELINPGTLVRPVGYSHGATTKQRGTRPVALAGQVGCGPDGIVEAPDNLVAQFGRALDNLLDVLREARGKPEDVASLRIYTLDVKAYKAQLSELGAAYRERFGNHYPAMALLGVRELFDDGALVEIEGVAYVD